MIRNIVIQSLSFQLLLPLQVFRLSLFASCFQTVSVLVFQGNIMGAEFQRFSLYFHP